MTGAPYLAYASSLNALTVWLAAELQGTAIKLNAVCPGYTATDLDGHAGTNTPAEAAQVVVRAATLDAAGPTGSFFEASGPVPW